MIGFVVSLVLMGLFVLLAVPFILCGLIVGAFFFLLAQVIVLPFRLLGWTARLGPGMIVSFMKLSFLSLVGIFSILAFGLGLFPLLAVVLICLGVWLVLRPMVGSRSKLPT